MATNISRVQNLVFQINNVKQEIEESFVISKILSILPDYFNYFSTAWDSTPKSEKTLTNLISRLSLEETKQKVKPDEGIAMSATKATKTLLRPGEKLLLPKEPQEDGFKNLKLAILDLKIKMIVVVCQPSKMKI
ncbi:hypothetical protein LAZ67_8001578 [Cordylochernes scorpioides]|uniref:Uncharacterized protein n=1 Tax=Cordylochernes scorpioides TaxID=51811 RepID=A0ABY6KR35_9ARAC|nr:hypothetical protein LAZ67_8001578 [Cordylochernes scorpioides]